MADSILELIVANVVTTCAGITTANGFDFDMASAQRFDVEGNSLKSLPVSFVSSGTQRKLVETNRTIEWGVEVTVDMHLVHDKAVDARSTDEVLLEARANLYKALMADRTRGGHAVDSTVEELEDFDLVMEDGRDTGVFVTLNVRFRHAQGDPTAAV